MGKIAALLDAACRERERLGNTPGLCSRVVAAGENWAVEDVVCTLKPNDPRFEEQHDLYRVALVGAGTFRCRSALGSELLTPGSLLLGNARECFECGHEHGSGDRCLAFAYAPAMLDQLAHEAGVRGRLKLGALRVPPVRAIAPLVVDAGVAWAGSEAEGTDWEELALKFAAAAVRLTAGPTREPRAPVRAERGVARSVQLIERDPGARLSLGLLAREAKLSRYHFVRAFARVTGLTPYQYVKRARLRVAAVRLATSCARIIDVAGDCGFGDVSTFNRAFRAEFGTTPRERRVRHGRAQRYSGRESSPSIARRTRGIGGPP